MTYSEKDIKTHSTVGGIRERPGMYIGSVGSTGVMHILREVLDNSVDEFTAGRNKIISIVVEGTTLYVADQGSGIPVNKKKVADTNVKESTLTSCITRLHAGGKFSESAYKASSGLNGVGLTATNSLSSNFQVWTYRGAWHTTCFKKGKEISPVQKTKKPKIPHLKVPDKGTIIMFTPDTSIFTGKLKIQHVKEWANLASYINGGLRIYLTYKGKTTEYFHKNGVADYVDYLITSLNVVPMSKPFVYHSDLLDIALTFTDYDGEHVAGYTNSLFNPDGGTHVTSLYAALTKVLKTHATKTQKFTAFDLREGLCGLINYRIHAPVFNGQTKEKLVDDRVTGPCTDLLTKELTLFFKSNKKLAKDLCRRAVELRSAKNIFTSNKKAMRDLKPRKGKALLPGKFTEVRKCHPKMREVYLCEGDSAAGTSRFARDPSYQEILPLKGKILNVLKAKAGQAFNSEEVLNILKVIGYDPSLKNPFDNLRVGKIILLSDNDSDGKHIDTLILTLLVTYLPELFEKGMVYVAEGAEYVIKHKGKNFFADSLEDLLRIAPRDIDKSKVLHMKGLGEMDAEALREISFDRKTRKLLQVTSFSKKEKNKFKALMGKNIEARKKLMGI